MWRKQRTEVRPLGKESDKLAGTVGTEKSRYFTPLIGEQTVNSEMEMQGFVLQGKPISQSGEEN